MPVFVVTDAMHLRPLARNARLAVDRRALRGTCSPALVTALGRIVGVTVLSTTHVVLESPTTAAGFAGIDRWIRGFAPCVCVRWHDALRRRPSRTTRIGTAIFVC